MTSRELKRINNFHEFKTGAGIDSIINFIANGVIPPGLNARQQARFIQRFGPGSGFVVRGVAPNQDLFYNPSPTINAEVVYPVNRQAVIQAVYDDPSQGYGKGLSSFYHQVAMSYLNISKSLTDAFLKRQGDYIVSVVPKKLINRPIVAKVSNERWGMDLIHMTIPPYPALGNNNRQYIMTVVDFFSGKMWARGLLNQQNSQANPTLRNALADICNVSGTIPHLMQGDQQFGRGDLLAWMNQQGITFIQTTSYNPVSNGKVERMNRTLRRKIKAGFIRNNNLIWYPFLQNYCDNINNQQNSRNKMTPNLLWSQGYNPQPANFPLPAPVQLNDNMTAQQRRDYNQRYLHNRAVRLLAIGRPPRTFQQNDLVRINLLKLNNTMRNAREYNIGWNKVAVFYTPEIYTIHNVIPAINNPPRRQEYEVSDAAGNVLMSGASPKRFAGNDLILVPNPNVGTNINPQTIARALFLNRLP